MKTTFKLDTAYAMQFPVNMFNKLRDTTKGLSESKHKNSFRMLHLLDLSKTTDTKASLRSNHSATHSIDHRCEGQCKAGASTSYQGNDDKWKALAAKRPHKLPPLVLSADVKRSQLEKLRDIPTEAKMAGEILASSGVICVGCQSRKLRNHKQLENLEKIKQAESASLENKIPSKYVQQQALFPSVNQNFGEKTLPNKLLIPLSSVSAKSEMVPKVQNDISDGNREPTHQAVRERLQRKQRKVCEDETGEPAK
ncbi:uncharacterized protein [Narcine bancroftii]|uniref:uncharacterized protein n=1 Tax=Narcine bancroftii TaxID=1343680 RepID=UPI0038311EDD